MASTDPTGSHGSNGSHGSTGSAANGHAANGHAARKARGNAGRPALVITDYTGWRSLLNPLWCYHGFRMAVVGLTCFGLIMVFSSSTVSMTSQGKSPFVQLISQGGFCLIGMVLGFIVMMMPVVFWKRAGIVVMVIEMLVQALTFTPLGIDVYGNKGWLNLGFTTIQPAEFMKFAMCVWLPSSLHACSKLYRKEGIKAYRVPVVVYAAGLLLVVGGKDLGTAMILAFIGVVAFLVAGFPGKWMGGGALVLVALVAVLAITSPNRMKRILATYGDCSAADAQTVCYQSMHAKYAIASGGFLGMGIGNSREKWNYLPAAHNDFIFAIIGEETGFVGAAIVLLFFVILGWCMIVVALQVADRYVAMVLMCVTIWIVGQAMVNIGVVVGVFPVLGVPMPFVSAGGSSMVMCLAAAGLVVGLMRSQPQIKQARASI
jgi:cell division protein FtsW